jgi:hypothetical protein
VHSHDGILTKKTEDNKLSQCHFVHQIPIQTDSGVNPDLRDEKPVTKRLSHGTAETSVNFYQTTRRNFLEDSLVKLMSDPLIADF